VVFVGEVHKPTATATAGSQRRGQSISMTIGTLSSLRQQRRGQSISMVIGTLSSLRQNPYEAADTRCNPAIQPNFTERTGVVWLDRCSGKIDGDLAFLKTTATNDGEMVYVPTRMLARRSKRSSIEADWHSIGQGKSKAMTSHRTPKHEPPYGVLRLVGALVVSGIDSTGKGAVKQNNGENKTPLQNGEI
jgi:hypothetical protein